MLTATTVKLLETQALIQLNVCSEYKQEHIYDVVQVAFGSKDLDLGHLYDVVQVAFGLKDSYDFEGYLMGGFEMTSC